MTRDQADALALMIHESWAGAQHVSRDAWSDELVELDYAKAERVIVTMRRSLQRPPTIADYISSYRSLIAKSQPVEKPDYSDAISLDEYLFRLQSKAQSHDPGGRAADELEAWRKWGHAMPAPTTLFSDA